MSIRAFLEDRQGTLWVATGSGLSRWDQGRFVTLYVEDGLAYGSVRSLAELRSGDIIVGTDGGVNRLRGGKFVQDPVLASVGPEKVWAILEDSEGALWLGTRGGGLFRVKQGKAAKFTTRDGLPSNSIYQLIEDASGRMWMSSPAGVFSASRKEMDLLAEGTADSLSVVSYGTADGESSQLNGGAQPAGVRTASGVLWFPGLKGAVVIDPDQLRTGPAAPVILESVAADEPAARHFRLRCPNPARPRQARDPLHHVQPCNRPRESRSATSWRAMTKAGPPTNRRSVNYTNLPPATTASASPQGAPKRP